MLKTSVICISYGLTAKLEESIFSFLNQTYENKELIIVNTSDINFQYFHPNVKLIKNNDVNLSIGEKRNLAILESDGDFIVNLNEGDLILPNYIKRIVNAFENNKDKDWIFPHADLRYNNTISKHLSLNSITLCFTRKVFDVIKYVNVNVGEFDIFWTQMKQKPFKGIFTSLEMESESYVVNLSVYENNDTILKPKYRNDYRTLISEFVLEFKKDKNVISSETASTWIKVKNTWDDAESFLSAVSSRGILTSILDITNINHTRGKRVSDEILKIRQTSCFGNNVEKPCYFLKTDGDKKYCGACGCGYRKLTQLNSTDDSYTKLMYPELECPLKRKGFSNSEK